MPTGSYKPFLLLSTRAENVAAHAEHLSFSRRTGIAPARLHQIRLESAALDPNFDVPNLADYSGIIVGGGPFNVMDSHKSEAQVAVETWFSSLLDAVRDRSFPFFGACYGIGLLGTAGNGVISRKFGEEASVAAVTKTDAGRQDPVLEGIPDTFYSPVGHKEAIEQLPKDAVLLGSGEHCPTQMFRLGDNAYATQFHPELDADTFAQRLGIYAGQGYYGPSGFEDAVLAARTKNIALSGLMLRNFAEIAAR